MSDRLSTADVAFFYLEGRTTPQHVGGIAIFTAPDGFDYDRLVRLLEERISLAPRYRQRMRTVPGNLANPVWVDDPNFDITYHVRRSALPRPGTEAALLEFCARIQSRLLDRSRPLWEMYLIEGLSGGRVAIVTKTHPSMVDGHGGIDITQVLLDESPEPRRTVEALWMPEREPSAARLVGDALWGAVRRPAAVVDAVRLSARDARSTASWLSDTLGGMVAGVTGMVAGAARPSRHSPLRTVLGQHRRIAIARPTSGWCASGGEARSTTSCWPSWPGRCAVGCSAGARRWLRPRPCGRWCRSGSTVPTRRRRDGRRPAR